MQRVAMSYRSLLLAAGALSAMALAAVNPWAGAAILGVTVVGLAWQLLATLDAPRTSLMARHSFEPLSAKDYAEMRRRYRHETA